MKDTRYTITSKKIIALALAFVMLAVILVGCTKNEPVNTDANKTTTEAVGSSQSGDNAANSNDDNIVESDIQTDIDNSTSVVDEESSSVKNDTEDNNTSKYNSSETTTKKNTSTGSSNKVTTCSHSWGEWYYEQIDEMYGAKKVHTCKKCGKKEYASEHKHTMSDWYVFSIDSDERYCIDCEDYYETRDADNRDKFMGTKSEYLELLNLINAERKKLGLEPHTYKSEWQAGADTRAKDLTESFSHTRPDGRKAYTAYTDNGFDCFSAAEAVAKGYASPSAVLNGWKSSERHWNLLMTQESQKVVIARCGTFWVVSFPV